MPKWGNMDDASTQDLHTDEISSQLHQLVSNSKLIDYEIPIFSFVNNLYEIAIRKSPSGENLRFALSALFDLAVSSLYLEKIVSNCR